MRAIPKDVIRFQVWTDLSAPPGMVEIRVTPDRWGAWEARSLLQSPERAGPVLLGRVFRSRDRNLAVGKMVRWVQQRFGRTRVISSLRELHRTPSG